MASREFRSRFAAPGGREVLVQEPPGEGRCRYAGAGCGTVHDWLPETGGVLRFPRYRQIHPRRELLSHRHAVQLDGRARWRPPLQPVRQESTTERGGCEAVAARRQAVHQSIEDTVQMIAEQRITCYKGT